MIWELIEFECALNAKYDDVDSRRQGVFHEEESLDDPNSEYVVPKGAVISIVKSDDCIKRVGYSFPEYCGCKHSFKMYIGFTESYEYCEHCGEKK